MIQDNDTRYYRYSIIEDTIIAMYSKQLRKICLYTDKINIYSNNISIPLPLIGSPLPPPGQIYQPLSACNQPYPTPTYYPPNSACGPCKCKK